MLPPKGQTIHWSELPPAEPGSLLAAEWERYRREVGRLPAEGHEDKVALIKGDKVVGIDDTREAAREAHRVHPILSREPVLRGPMRTLFRALRIASMQVEHP